MAADDHRGVQVKLSSYLFNEARCVVRLIISEFANLKNNNPGASGRAATANEVTFR